MGWKGVTVMDQRVRFIAEYLEGYFPFNELCLQFNIIRRVSRNSGIRWSSRRVQVSSTLAEEYIGFEEIDNGIHNVYFCELLIGRFMEKTMKIEDVIERVPIRQTVVECGNPKMRRRV
ncbi:MAG: hypothetical protein A4E63_01691 [Syntrophorhabdus sp. PtaU1.Bin050]|nr:MAG: hypothetical protein A4E63_01691 [Syntrophorhabdus sp. PtaU1.Bin050]